MTTSFQDLDRNVTLSRLSGGVLVTADGALLRGSANKHDRVSQCGFQLIHGVCRNVEMSAMS